MAPYPQVYTSEPFFRTAREAWEVTFRFGPPGSWDSDPARRSTHPGLRFPVGAIEQFMKQSLPRWATNDNAAQAAYDALVERVGECIVLAHSQGANFALRAAVAAPDLVARRRGARRLGCSRTFGGGRGSVAWRAPPVPVGRFLDQHPFWVESVPNVRRWHDALIGVGADTEWLDLPACGIHGNSHAMMMDDNSDQVAQLVLHWLESRDLLVPR